MDCLAARVTRSEKRFGRAFHHSIRLGTQGWMRQTARLCRVRSTGGRRRGNEVTQARPGRPRVGRVEPPRKEEARFLKDSTLGISQTLSNARCREAPQRTQVHEASCRHAQSEGAGAKPCPIRPKPGWRPSSPTERAPDRTLVAISRATSTRHRQRQAAGIQFSESSYLARPQRTAVQLRLHQETKRCQNATSEPVVLHHGREVRAMVNDEAWPSASTACWAADSRLPGASCELLKSFVTRLPQSRAAWETFRRLSARRRRARCARLA
jgi:hypothetical protein